MPRTKSTIAPDDRRETLRTFMADGAERTAREIVEALSSVYVDDAGRSALVSDAKAIGLTRIGRSRGAKWTSRAGAKTTPATKRPAPARAESPHPGLPPVEELPPEYVARVVRYAERVRAIAREIGA